MANALTLSNKLYWSPSAVGYVDGTGARNITSDNEFIDVGGFESTAKTGTQTDRHWHAEIVAGSQATWTWITFRAPFTTPPTVIICLNSDSTAYQMGQSNFCVFGTTSTTSFTPKWVNQTGATRYPGFSWIAIGK